MHAQTTWLICLAAVATVGLLLIVTFSQGQPTPTKPFYQCPDDYRPKDSFVETCVASRQAWVGEPLQVKLDCLSYAAMHGYCEAIAH